MSERNSLGALLQYADAIRPHIPEGSGVIIFLADEAAGDVAVVRAANDFELDREVLRERDSTLTPEEREGGHDLLFIGSDSAEDIVIRLTDDLAALFAVNRLSDTEPFNLGPFLTPEQQASQTYAQPQYFMI